MAGPVRCTVCGKVESQWRKTAEAWILRSTCCDAPMKGDTIGIVKDLPLAKKRGAARRPAPAQEETPDETLY